MNAISALKEFDESVRLHREQMAEMKVAHESRYLVRVRVMSGFPTLWADLVPQGDEVDAFIDAAIERKLPARRAELVRQAKEEARALLATEGE